MPSWCSDMYARMAARLTNVRGPRRGYQPDHMWDLPDGQHERNPCASNKFLSGCIFASAQSPKPDPRSSPLVPQNACTPAKSPERPAMRCEAEWSQRFSWTCKRRRQQNASDQMENVSLPLSCLSLLVRNMFCPRDPTTSQICIRSRKYGNHKQFVHASEQAMPCRRTTEGERAREITI